MHGWIKQDDQDFWCKCTNPQQLLDHQGPMVFCESNLDDSTIVEKIRLLDDAPYLVKANDWRVVASEFPVVTADSLPEFYVRIKAGEKIGILSSGYGYNNWVAVYDSKSGKNTHAHKTLDGVVFVSGHPDVYTVFYDMKLWKKVMVQARKLHREGNGKLVMAQMFWTFIGEVREAFGVKFPNSVTVDQILPWIAAGDVKLGRRKVNQLLRPMARKWAKNPVKNLNKFNNWMDAEKLEERLRLVARFPEPAAA